MACVLCASGRNIQKCYGMFLFQVDGMLHKLEKEIDDVDAKIGDRWRLLDRFVAISSYII